MRTSRTTITLAIAALAAVVLAAAAIFVWPNVGSGAPTGSQAATGLPGPAGTGIVTRIAVEPDAAFSWAPDGGHLLVWDQSGSRVFDRFGKQVSEFAPLEGWLDSSHLIGPDGTVADIGHSVGGSPLPNTAVVANGHGSAAIIVARPGCVGDPLVDWYRNGRYEKANESVTPFGWSSDGTLAVLGHMTCGALDAEMNGWKGTVQVRQIATGRVVATLPDVRGDMAFSPGGDDLAAQSDASLEIADLTTGKLSALPGLRFLGWLDDETIFVSVPSGIEVVDLDPPTPSTATYDEWQVASPDGLHVSADISGTARRILAADGSTLMDLTSEQLVLESPPAPGQPVFTRLQPGWWSPDGRMLVLASADGRSLALISVDPSQPKVSSS